MRSLFLVLIGCHGGVGSQADAELAALGLEGAVERGLALGFQGYNTASSANIDPQTDAGDFAGTMTVTGQVDQGNSANKGMRLQMDLVDYADVQEVDNGADRAVLVYNTPTPADLDLSLRGIPDGTLSGTLVGTFLVDGDLRDDVALDLAFEGLIEPQGQGTRPTPGSTNVTGTATTPSNTWTVDVTF